MMINTWKIEDIIDLEYFHSIDRLQQDRQPHDFHKRERQLFLEAQKQGELYNDSHSQCLAVWLARRRMIEPGEANSFIPGRILGDLLHLFRWIFVICGLALGFFLGLSYFVYTGTTPLNVFTFFTLFILPQLALLCLFFLRTFLTRLTRRPRTLMQGVVGPLFHRFVTLMKKRNLADLGEEQARSFNHLFSAKNSKLLSWSIFVQAQFFGVAFNIGLLAVILFKITTSDLAFGWQTTLELGAEGLNSIVQMVALPWSWLLPAELSFPTLAQIEGSRILLKQAFTAPPLWLLCRETKQ